MENEELAIDIPTSNYLQNKQFLVVAIDLS
jgi:hypothetical protein